MAAKERPYNAGAPFDNINVTLNLETAGHNPGRR